MAATIKASTSPFRQLTTERNSNSIHSLDEELASVPASGIPEEFRKLSRFLPVIVLVPTSAVHGMTRKKAGPNQPVTGLTDIRDVCFTLNAAKQGLNIPSASDTFEFGGVTVCFSAMEIHRNGRPVSLGSVRKDIAHEQ
jgi:hypothetical protein